MGYDMDPVYPGTARRERLDRYWAELLALVHTWDEAESVISVLALYVAMSTREMHDRAFVSALSDFGELVTRDRVEIRANPPPRIQ